MSLLPETDAFNEVENETKTEEDNESKTAARNEIETVENVLKDGEGKGGVVSKENDKATVAPLAVENDKSESDQTDSLSTSVDSLLEDSISSLRDSPTPTPSQPTPQSTPKTKPSSHKRKPSKDKKGVGLDLDAVAPLPDPGSKLTHLTKNRARRMPNTNKPSRAVLKSEAYVIEGT